jgi:hypothetical protein
MAGKQRGRGDICFPKHNHDKKSNGSGHFNKSQWNNSGNTRKCKPDHEVAAVKRNPRGKKSGNNDSEYEKIMHKQCPIHPESRHTLFDCVTIHKENKEDGEEGDKSGAQDFQDPKNVVNVIFGDDSGFPAKRAEVNPARNTFCGASHDKTSKIQQVPIFFFRDDQWTSFSELEKFPLFLDPVVVGSQLT